MRNRHFSRRGLLLLVSVLSCLAFFPPLSVVADELDQEFLFASGLVSLGMPDYADKVVQQILRLHPDQKDRAKLIQSEILISRRKFVDAEEIVKTMGENNPKAQAIGLALAKGYYAAGELDKAKRLYDGFFKQYEGRVPSDPDLLRFYQESAYQFGQMLETAGDKGGAVGAYGRVLTTNPDKNIRRRIMAKQAELEVQIASDAAINQREKLLSDATKLCETIQWGGLDIWFGQSIITLSHIQLVKNDRAGAQKVIQKNLDILKEIDKFIQEQGLPMSESPMAGARFLLGDLLQQDADLLARQDKKDEAVQAYGKALGEFYNVFAKYGDSEWGVQAGVRAQAIKKILLDKFGKKVNVELGSFQDKAAENQLRLARNLYVQKQYKTAAEEYLKVLNQFPETDASAGALANLALAYANLNDTQMVQMVCGYIAERFKGKTNYAVALLLVGKHYFDKKNEPMYMYVYETYLNSFPKHERAAAILFTLAGLRKQANDSAGAMKYYQRIISHYPNDQFYPKALSQIAWAYFLSSNYQAAAQSFTNYLHVAQPSFDKAQAQFALAESRRQVGQLPAALAEYEKLIEWLAPKQNPYSTSEADANKNLVLLEKAVFQRAGCCARMKDPPEAVADYRRKAIKTYDQFVALFPQSALAPKAMNGKGSALLELGQFDQAAKAFDELAVKYPQSEEGKSALFSLVRSAMEIKQYGQAKSAFEKMLAGGGAYSSDKFARIGQLMLDAKLYPEAIQAFERAVKSTTEDRNILETSYYGLGRAYYEEKDYLNSIKALENLMAKYPNSGLFYDAKFTLGNAYRQAGSLSNAVAALSDVFRYANQPTLINKASYDLGVIQKELNQKDAALASFLRVSLLADSNDSELRPLIEKSLLEAIPLAIEQGKYQDATDACDQYMKLFPTGNSLDAVRKYKADVKMKAMSAPAQP
jgi:tetratricopeptide (TPR) repeat protein